MRLALLAAVILAATFTPAAMAQEAIDYDVNSSLSGWEEPDLARAATLDRETQGVHHFCKKAGAERYRSSPGSGKVWRYFLKVSWCFTISDAGYKITEISHRRWTECCGVFWDFEGHIGFAQSGGAGRVSATRFTQGKFQYCVTRLGCTLTKTPWIEMHVVANGDWWAETDTGRVN